LAAVAVVINHHLVKVLEQAAVVLVTKTITPLFLVTRIQFLSAQERLETARTQVRTPV
jgi:hypothetical protein